LPDGERLVLATGLHNPALALRDVFEWTGFWRELGGNRSSSSLFREYVAPNQDASTVFLRSYYRFPGSLE
jgi:hypothetical protein